MSKPSPKPDFKSLIGTPLERAFKLKKDVIDVATRTAKQVSITSDEPILHWVMGRGIAYVILDHSPKSINLERFQSGGAFLENHDPNKRLGRARNLVTDGKVLRADIRFSGASQYQRDTFDEVNEDLENGDSPGTSTGFTIERIAEKIESYIEGIPVVRATKWTPYEVSLASIEADLRTGFGRCIGDTTRMADAEEETDETIVDDEGTESADEEDAEENDEPPTDRGKQSTNKKARTKSMTIAATPTPATTATPPPPTVAQLLQARTTEFVDTAALFGDTEEQKTAFRTLARTLALDDAKTIDDLKRDILQAMKDAQVSLQTTDPKALARSQGGGVQFGYVSKPRNFKGENAAERAYRFGMWALAGPFSQLRNHSMPASTRAALAAAETYCRDHGILVRMGTGQNETLNEAGGYTVPHEFGNDLIDLREEYGVFRSNAKIVPMASDSRSDPRRAGGMTAYWEDETDALEASMKTWDRVGLKAKKLTALGKFSREVSEDSMVNFGDDLAGEIAYAFVAKEDGAGFLGDGTKPYGGIRGVCTRLTSLNLANGTAATIAQTSGLKVATGTGSYGGILLSDFSKTKSRLPRFAFQRGIPKWYMHQSFFYDIVEPLIFAAGGITADMIAAGVPLRLSGYEVVPTQVMPSQWAIDQVVALFGVLPLAASLGDRRQTSIELSDQVYWTTDEIGIKGTERLDINVHDVGGASNTASERAVGGIAGPGPIVGLITAHT